MSAVKEQVTISPVSQQPVFKIPYTSATEIESVIKRSIAAQKKWRKVPLEERIKLANRIVDQVEKDKEEIAKEITEQMGRPIRYTAGEVNGFLQRARHLISIAPRCLADVDLKETDTPGFTRWIRKEPIGVVLIIGAWNYPYLILVNSLIPSLLSGNSVILKPSPQTPSSSLRFSSMDFIPKDLVQTVIVGVEEMTDLVADPRLDFVQFTGSVEKGKMVERAANSKDGVGLKGVGLELGGKDAAYVREDADVKYAAAEVADGAFFNSGQSCCGIERVYVHEKVYDEFVKEITEVTKGYKLGDPSDPETTLGPVVSLAFAINIRQHISDAVSKGGKQLIPKDLFPLASPESTYVAPEILVNVDHTMKLMSEETFGPVIGIMKVKSDEEAIELINDSRYGLTASVWTKDEAKFEEIVPELEVGTVFMNRADNLDPALCWTGVKDSGRGVSLSQFGYDQLTRFKSVNKKVV
ncbi:succinate semialdehyde dehydrogenase [Atractiella rhizophila]|nr:succinate semialdehyde dehydrogenase [Atractiella rhizophila]